MPSSEIEAFTFRWSIATPAELAQQFQRAKPETVAEILETLATVGHSHLQGNKFTR